MINRIRLSPFTVKNIERTFAWVSDRGLQDAFLMRIAPNRETNEAYFAQVLADPTQRVYGIFLDEAHIGNCGLKHISHANKSCELWIYLGESQLRCKGIGNKALQLLLQEGTDRLGISDICAHVAKGNVAARRLYHQNGFQEVGGCGAEWDGREVIRMLWTKEPI